MTNPLQAPTLTLSVSLRVTSVILAFACALILRAQPAHAQTYNVIHNFTGCADGYGPTSTLLLDGAGRLYGTTPFGGAGCSNNGGVGLFFRLQRAGSGWVETPLHTFMPRSVDGMYPEQLTAAPDGGFYLPTDGGGEYGQGAVFRLQPPPTACHSVSCPWETTNLHSFRDDSYGYVGSNVVFDSAGNLYGNTLIRDGSPDGTLFELMNSAGTWTISVLYSFFNETYVMSGLTVDSAGNLYGASYSVFSSCGTIFELSPSGSGWVFNTLYAFTCASDGGVPEGTPVLDQAGNLYGTTHCCGSGGGAGTVFELSPAGGGWTFSLLYSFVEGSGGPGSALTMDPAGNFYGTTVADGAHSQGSVFKLTRNGNSWTYTDLHDFPSQPDDGIQPEGGVTLDSSGNLYGTTSAGGTSGAGVAWEITP